MTENRIFGRRSESSEQRDSRGTRTERTATTDRTATDRENLSEQARRLAKLALKPGKQLVSRKQVGRANAALRKSKRFIPSAAPELTRDRRIHSSLTQFEFADLKFIAKSWGVPLETAVYAIVATFIADCRDGPLQLVAKTAEKGVAINASARILLAQGDYLLLPDPPGEQ